MAGQGTPGDGGPEKESLARSIADWITTAQGIITTIATLITLIAGGTVIVNNNNSPKAPAPASPPTSAAATPNPPTSAPATSNQQILTPGQAKAALLTSSDLAGIDTNLTYNDVTFPRPGSCKPAVVKPVINVSREFSDAAVLQLDNEIEIYNSPNDARMAFVQDAQQVTCSFTSQYSISSISSQLAGMCDESSAWAVKTVNSNDVKVSGYMGMVRCGRALAFFDVGTSRGSSFDTSSTLVRGMEVAVPKVQNLL